MRFLVAGAGIAGLFTAYSLHKKYKTSDIVVVEKSDRLGGRIQSVRMGNQVVEMGAGVVLDNHTEVLRLIDELGLGDRLKAGRGKRVHVELDPVRPGGAVTETVYRIREMRPLTETGFYDTMFDLRRRIDVGEIDPTVARCYSLHRLLERVHGVGVADRLRAEFGYDADFNDQNAVDAVEMFTRGAFRPDRVSHILEGGLSQIISRLRDRLVGAGIRIRLRSELVDIRVVTQGTQYDCSVRDETGVVDTIRADVVVLALPKMGLQRIPFLEPVRSLLQSVSCKALMRIYARFPIVAPSTTPWFRDLGNQILTTDTVLRQIVPIGDLLMIYVDDGVALSWRYLKEAGLLESELLFHLRRVFSDTTIPAPVEVRSKYWGEATHVWRPTVESGEMSRRVLHPFPLERVYIVGESYSLQQEWSQGALLTVRELMKILAV